MFASILVVGIMVCNYIIWKYFIFNKIFQGIMGPQYEKNNLKGYYFKTLKCSWTLGLNSY